MVCDVSTFESMAQRFGRVNRYGNRPDTRIDVVHPNLFGKLTKDKLEASELDKRRQKTLELLKRLPLLGENRHDASPKALSDLRDRADLPCKIEDAFVPVSTIPPATDILFDAWSLTTIRGPMPGRPPVEPYLHGITEWEPPQTHVAWREEVRVVTGELLEKYPPADLLDDYPLKPHELLKDRSDRILQSLKKLAKKHGDEPVWILSSEGVAIPTTLGDLVDDGKEHINHCTVLLPPSAGGLKDGMLDGTSDQADDVADIPPTDPGSRLRIWHEDPSDRKTPEGMRLVRSLIFESEDEDESRSWGWYESFPLEGGRAARRAVRLDVHTNDVFEQAKGMVNRLSLTDKIGEAVLLAARFHDRGKDLPAFQATLGNRAYPDVVLAKSGRTTGKTGEPVRHELASLIEASQDAEFRQMPQEMQDLVLHLIAAHHGRARPHFDASEAFLPDRPQSEVYDLVAEIPRRFARLQRRYGRWGLAYLESLLRAADWAASAEPSSYTENAEVNA
jgi:CRISPR-associated endonuclease/helicase Cas3